MEAIDGVILHSHVNRGNLFSPDLGGGCCLPVSGRLEGSGFTGLADSLFRQITSEQQCKHSFSGLDLIMIARFACQSCHIL